MSNYSKLTNFATKDSLASGNPLKVIKGTEIDDEFEAIETSIATKADSASPTFTGTPAAPTAALSTNSTQLATTAFVKGQITSGGYVTTAGIAADAINGTKIADDSIDSEHYVAGSIDTEHLADSSVTSAKIADGTITGSDIASSVALAGSPTTTTQTSTDSTTKIATTAFVQAQKASPALTGTPTAPTATSTTNSTQIATTAFVQAQKASPALTGTPTAPTASAGTNTTQIATTEFTTGGISTHAALRSSSSVYGHAKIYKSGSTLYIVTV